MNSKNVVNSLNKVIAEQKTTIFNLPEDLVFDGTDLIPVLLNAA